MRSLSWCNPMKPMKVYLEALPYEPHLLFEYFLRLELKLLLTLYVFLAYDYKYTGHTDVLPQDSKLREEREN